MSIKFGKGQPLALILALLAAAFMLFPLYWVLVSSLKTVAQLFAYPPAFFPSSPQWSIFPQVIAQQGGHLLTSLIVSAGVVCLSLVITIPAAYALAKFDMKVTVILVFILLIVQMIPSVSLSNALFLIFHHFGLLNSYQGLILADSTYSVPFDVLILRAFFLGIPNELVEAALVDGASDWRALWRIIFPVSRSAIITAGLFSFLFAWGDFLFALTMTTSNSIQPITLSIYRYLGTNTTDWNALMATAVLTSIPAAILLIFAQRYITSGISTTGLK